MQHQNKNNYMGFNTIEINLVWYKGNSKTTTPLNPIPFRGGGGGTKIIVVKLQANSLELFTFIIHHIVPLMIIKKKSRHYRHIIITFIYLELSLILFDPFGYEPF